MLALCISLVFIRTESASASPSLSAVALRKSMTEVAAPTTPGGIPAAEFIVKARPDTRTFEIMYLI